MNRALKSALIELKNEGVSLDPIADLEHLLTLHSLSLAMIHPPHPPGERAVFGPSLRVGHITLRRLSLGARRFVVDVAAEWFREDMQAQDLAYAYCMAIGSEPEKLWAVQNNKAAFVKSVRAWERTIGVPFDELRVAIQRFLDVEKAEPGTKAGPREWRAALATLDGWKPLPEPYKTECQAALIAVEVERENEASLYGRDIERLSREYGRRPEDLVWRTPEAELELLLYNLREKQDAEERALQGAQDSRFMRAHHAFSEYKDMVLRIKKGATP